MGRNNLSEPGVGWLRSTPTTWRDAKVETKHGDLLILGDLDGVGIVLSEVVDQAVHRVSE
ncbi:hypothetical protein Pan54_15080 [Rubinisphaera italica]|uniref:Uncharacterized protein n=1 Tax=Rubinisphaera italica TaxID=2527969 RepID=A0A5C5XEE4_9PLAN|nr:hypothetical protein Pan54_15080 [Rubinisphaera italica]